MSPHVSTPWKVRSKNLESWTASHATGMLGRLRRNAWTKEGAASTPKTLRPSAARTSVMGKPGPQPRSITEAPHGSVRAHCRTSFTPMPVKRPLPRRSRNSWATPSYPFDRSAMEPSYQDGFVASERDRPLPSQAVRRMLAAGPEMKKGIFSKPETTVRRGDRRVSSADGG